MYLLYSQLADVAVWQSAFTSAKLKKAAKMSNLHDF